MSRNWLFVLLLSTGVALADEAPEAKPEPAATQGQEQKPKAAKEERAEQKEADAKKKAQKEADAKSLSGMSVLGNQEVQIVLVGAFKIASAEHEAVVVGVAARLQQLERALERVVAGDGARRVPEHRGLRGRRMESRPGGHELDGAGGIRIRRARAPIGADFPAFRGLSDEGSGDDQGQRCENGKTLHRSISFRNGDCCVRLQARSCVLLPGHCIDSSRAGREHHEAGDAVSKGA